MKQKDVFLESEGDAWFERNSAALAARRLPDDDPLLSDLLGLPLLAAESNPPVRILEVGCGEGRRLEWLAKYRGARCAGVDPSAKAVAIARERGIDAHQATAERLPFGAANFDLLIFGFCLYLCDRDDLFGIACEADRVLHSPGWIAIMDFYSSATRSRSYSHRAGLLSYKMDYRTLFTWHPDYACHSHRLIHHVDGSITDVEDEWVGVSLLRKRPRDGREAAK